MEGCSGLVSLSLGSIQLTRGGGMSFAGTSEGATGGSSLSLSCKAGHDGVLSCSSKLSHSSEVSSVFLLVGLPGLHALEGSLEQFGGVINGGAFSHDGSSKGSDSKDGSHELCWKDFILFIPM